MPYNWLAFYSYDCVSSVQSDVFSAQLEELRHLEHELGHLPQKWSVHLDKLELPTPEQLTVSKIFTKIIKDFYNYHEKYRKIQIYSCFTQNSYCATKNLW